MARLVKAGVTLRDQLNKAFPSRDKKSDGWIGDSAHQARKSDHNPDRNGWVHALDIDEDFLGNGKGQKKAKQFADELIKLAREGKDGGRLKYVVYENAIASGTYKNKFWVWRTGNWGHTEHVHVSFTNKAQKNASGFDLPIFEEAKKPAPKPEPPKPASTPKVPKYPTTLEYGKKNKDVERLQKKLIEKGFEIPAGATGYYGDQTARAVKQFYRSMDLTSNGKRFGLKAWNRLFG